MSTGTNRERIEQNNIKLEEIKGKIDKLPEYQDIKPIYATTDYSNFKITYLPDPTTYPYTNAKVSRLDNYIIIQYQKSTWNYSGSNYSNAYLYEIQQDNSLKQLATINIGNLYGGYYTKIFCKTSDKLYIWSYYFNGGSYPTDIYYYVYHIDTGVLDKRTTTPMKDRWHASSTILGNGIWYDKENKAIYSFNPNTLETTKKYSLDFDTTYANYIGNNCFIETYSSSKHFSRLYKMSGTTLIKSKLLESDTSTYYNGLSYDSTRIFANGNCYSTNAGLEIGDLLSENVCKASSYIYVINDKYYVVDNALCTFDTNTNSFSQILSLEYLSLYDNHVFGFEKFKAVNQMEDSGTGLTLFDFGTSDRMIGFTYNGVRYPIDNEERLKANYILSGNAAYTYEGNKLLGTMPNNGGLNYTPSTEEQTIPVGYTSGGTVAAVTSDIDSNIVAENIKKDVSILGVTGTLESGGSSDYNARLVPTNGKIISYITEISTQLDTSNVTDMSYMFDSCTNLTTIPLLDTSKVTNMENMFINCTSLTTIPLLDTSSVTDMRNMFDSCTNLTTIPLLDTSKVTTMQFMFNNCENLTTIPLLDTSNIGNMPYMFNNCTSLTTVPQLDTSSVISMNRIFNNCTSLSDESLNNILAMCKNAVKITSNKTLKYLGLTSEQANKCKTLSNYSAFTAAGWITGY